MKMFNNEEEVLFHPPKITIHPPKGNLMNEVDTKVHPKHVHPDNHGKAVSEVAKAKANEGKTLDGTEAEAPVATVPSVM